MDRLNALLRCYDSSIDVDIDFVRFCRYSHTQLGDPERSRQPNMKKESREAPSLPARRGQSFPPLLRFTSWNEAKISAAFRKLQADFRHVGCVECLVELSCAVLSAYGSALVLSSSLSLCISASLSLIWSPWPMHMTLCCLVAGSAAASLSGVQASKSRET